jgi:lipid II:glycine glycyltransferase (peptidoglycan interpeptide bridge formation enzyme)
MTLQIITPDSEQWDLFVARQRQAHVLQQAAWGALKGAYGWTAARVALSDGMALHGGAQVLFRALPLRLGTMAYLGMGPYADDPAWWPQLWTAVDTLARQHGAAFLKWEPGIYRAGESPPDFAGWGFHESLQTVQPPRTILVDIRGDEDTILARMNQGTRRKIRQSLKSEVQYYEAAQGDVTTFTAMMQTTGTRNDFGVHEPAYYEKAYALFVPSGDAALILATHEGDALAGIMVFAKGETAWYLYGASSNVKRNLMAAYGVQWRAMQWARARGCTVYDMWGVPDADADTLEAQFQERDDGLWGVYGFKRGWGGEVVRSAGAWDRVYNPLVYNAYKMALRVRG